MSQSLNESSVFAHTRQVLLTDDPSRKCELITEVFSRWRDGKLTLDRPTDASPINEPGRPVKPMLVNPRKLKKRSLHTELGRASFMHAIAHIEFNAINLACDAVCRFSNMPVEFYDNWLEVAADEARHFQLLVHYLADRDCRYGDYPAHNGLWDLALKTSEDVLVRMALVPRVLEARGLDVTPKMIQQLKTVNDLQAADILGTIYTEEIRHVAYGSYWFKYLCAQRKLDVQATFFELISQYFEGDLRGPFNLSAREQAGFSEEELHRLAQF